MRRFAENIKIAFQSLTVNKLRSFLTMLGIIIGVGAVVAMLAIGTGAQDSVIQSVQDIGSNLIIVVPGNQEDEQQGFEQMLGDDKDAEALKIEDAKAIGKEANLVSGAAPVILSSSIVSYLNRNTRASVYASSEKAEDIYSFEIEKGNFFSSSDVANSSNVAVLGQTVINELFGNIDPMGEIIKVDGKNFTVICIVKSKGTDQFGNDQDNVVSMPITTAQNKLYRINTVDNIMVEVENKDLIDKASNEIENILRK